MNVSVASFVNSYSLRWNIGSIVLLFLATSCATTPSSEQVPPDLSSISVDPLECTRISLRNDIPITKDVIHEQSFMQDWSLLVLKYQESEAIRPEAPKTVRTYLNVFLTSEVKEEADGSMLIGERYCVVEIWTISPNEKTKACRMWRVGDNEVWLKLLFEDITGGYLSERQIPLGTSERVRLKSFFRQLLQLFMERLNEQSKA